MFTGHARQRGALKENGLVEELKKTLDWSLWKPQLLLFLSEPLLSPTQERTHTHALARHRARASIRSRENQGAQALALPAFVLFSPHGEMNPPEVISQLLDNLFMRISMQTRHLGLSCSTLSAFRVILRKKDQK